MHNCLYAEAKAYAEVEPRNRRDEESKVNSLLRLSVWTSSANMVREDPYTSEGTTRWVCLINSQPPCSTELFDTRVNNSPTCHLQA